MTAPIPTLRGSLTFIPAHRGETARLSWRGRCPACRLDHTHGWHAPAGDLAEVRHRVAHCVGGPLEGRGYYIGLADDAANQRALDFYSRAVAGSAVQRRRAGKAG